MKKIIFLLVFVLILLSMNPFLYWQNHTFGITKYTVVNHNIPPAFDGYKILQISDIQGQIFGSDNRILIDQINKRNANIIVLTGDLVDEGVTNSKKTMDVLLKGIKDNNVLYAVSGNHDIWSGHFPEYKKDWESNYQVHFLENESYVIKKEGQQIYLHGISDPDVWVEKEADEIVNNALQQLNIINGYNILLFHRANMLDMFHDIDFDLILSGHIHGGQIRIPFIGGLKSPHGNWFPKYSGGKYQIKDKTYIVSRGLGNAVSVPRIFNRPELVEITLKSK